MNGRRCKPVYGFQLPSRIIKAGFIARSSNPVGFRGGTPPSLDLDHARQAHLNPARHVRHNRQQRFGLLAGASIEVPLVNLRGKTTDLSRLLRPLLQTSRRLLCRPCRKDLGKVGEEIRRRAVCFADRTGMIGRHFNCQEVWTARGVVDPSLTRIGAEQAMKTIVRHDGELLFRSELPNRAVVREFFEAHPGESLDELDRCRRSSMSWRGTERDDSCEPDEAKTRDAAIPHVTPLSRTNAESGSKTAWSAHAAGWRRNRPACWPR